MNVYKGRLVTINTNNGFDLTDLLGQAALATATAGIVNME